MTGYSGGGEKDNATMLSPARIATDHADHLAALNIQAQDIRRHADRLIRASHEMRRVGASITTEQCMYLRANMRAIQTLIWALDARFNFSS